MAYLRCSQREIEACRSRVEEGDAISRKLRGDLAEAEGRALQDKAREYFRTPCSPRKQRRATL